MRSLIEDDRRRQDPENVEIGPDEISLDLLRAVYRSNSLPLSTRMRAAISALKHEVPALGVQFVVNDSDIATRLDKAIARIEATKVNVINGEKVVSEPTLIEEPKPSPPTPAPLNRLYNKRLYRRI